MEQEVKCEDPRANQFQEERGWEKCQECPIPVDEDEAMLEPATAPSTQEPEEADSDTDWDWDMPGASPSDDTVGALVVDDYLIVGEPIPCSSRQPQEADKEGVTGCNAAPGPPPLTADTTADVKAEPAPTDLTVASLDEEEPPTDPHTADGAAGPSGQKQLDKPGYRCLVCDNPIFQDEDILSSNYHAMTGPGYLTSAANNVCIALEMQTQLYTTGKYTVREVSCSTCAAMLGVTYAGAADVRNRYKVGKFLLGRDRLCLPPGVVHPMDELPK